MAAAVYLWPSTYLHSTRINTFNIKGKKDMILRYSGSWAVVAVALFTISCMGERQYSRTKSSEKSQPVVDENNQQRSLQEVFLENAEETDQDTQLSESEEELYENMENQNSDDAQTDDSSSDVDEDSEDNASDENDQGEQENNEDGDVEDTDIDNSDDEASDTNEDASDDEDSNSDESSDDQQSDNSQTDEDQTNEDDSAENDSDEDSVVDENVEIDEDLEEFLWAERYLWFKARTFNIVCARDRFIGSVYCSEMLRLYDVDEDGRLDSDEYREIVRVRSSFALAPVRLIGYFVGGFFRLIGQVLNALGGGSATAEPMFICEHPLYAQAPLCRLYYDWEDAQQDDSDSADQDQSDEDSDDDQDSDSDTDDSDDEDTASDEDDSNSDA